MSLNYSRSSQMSGPRIPEDYPCMKERGQSMKCLEMNDYDYSKCQLAFDNFQFCTRFWDKVKDIRRRYGVEPVMPSSAERAEIYQLYKSTGTLPDYSSKDK